MASPVGKIEDSGGNPADHSVSVIVATNRGGPFLAEAIESALGQTYSRIEVVVVDDGSSDPASLTAITDRYPTVRVVHQANAGSSVARNNGVAQTSGDLLVFLDDDDRWSPERIARQVAALDAQPDAVASYCGMQTIDADGNLLVPADQWQVRDVHEILRRRTGIILPNVMVRRTAFQRIGGFHPSFRRAQDLDLVLKLAIEGPFVFVPETLVDYRHHPGNNTRQHHELCRSIDHVVRLHRWAAMEKGRTDLVADHDISLQANRRFAAWSSSRRARELLRRGHFLQAGSEAFWLARFAPTAPLDWLAGHRSKRAAST
jgi:glycosyltransferase involved in cell wall biosynthesis